MKKLRALPCISLAACVISSVTADTLPDKISPDTGGEAQCRLEDVIKKILIPDSILYVKRNDSIRLIKGVGGLIINQMVSRSGQEFYDWFCSNWQEIRGNPGYNIILKEKVVSRQSSQVTIFADEKKVSMFQLTPQTDDVAQTGSEQIDIVRYYIRSPEKMELLLYEDAE